MIDFAAPNTDLAASGALAGKPLSDRQGSAGASQSDLASPMFSGYLDKAMSPTATPEEKLRYAAKMYVSSSMIMPMFEKMRNDPLAANLFHGGRSEKVFQQQMDQMLSDRIAGATRFDLTDAIYNELSSKMVGSGLNTHG